MPYPRKWWNRSELIPIRNQNLRAMEYEIPGTSYLDLSEFEKEDSELSYWMDLYPDRMKKIQKIVEETCDKLDYDGSILYDEFPDRVSLRRICTQMLERLKEEKEFQNEAEDEVEVTLYEMSHFGPPRRPWPGNPPPSGPWPGNPPPPPPPGFRPGTPQPPRPPRRPPENPWMRDAAEVLLYQEMHRRRCGRSNCRKKRFF